MKKYYVAIFVLICILGGVIWYTMERAERVPESSYDQIVLYYGRECPHCKDLFDFILQNDVHAKVSFLEKEVYHDRANLMELVKRANMCGMRTDVLEVPFIWTGSKCLTGNDKVIVFLKEKISEKSKKVI